MIKACLDRNSSEGDLAATLSSRIDVAWQSAWINLWLSSKILQSTHELCALIDHTQNQTILYRSPGTQIEVAFR